MKRTWSSIFSVLVIIGLLLSACGKDEDEATKAPPPESTQAPAAVEPAVEPATDPEAAKYGGIFRFNYFRSAGRFGYPPNVRHSDHFYASLALQKLVQPDEEQAGALQGVLAESWELAADKSSYTFYLRKGVKFHDGTDFNAEAVKWNLEIAMAAKRPQFSAVTSVEVIDEHTLQVNLSRWNNLVISDFGSDLGFIISPTAFEANGGEDWANTHPVGTGPWKLKDLQPNISISFDKFEDYWVEGLPYADGLEIYHIPDSMTALASLQAGELHSIYSLDPVSGSELQAMGGYDIYTQGAPHILITMNTTDPDSVWTDKRMREALEYAVDKESITAALGLGFSDPIYEVIHSIHLITDPGTTPRTYDPDKARELIAQAGYGDGIKIAVTVNADGPQDVNVALQANLADVGIEVELNPVAGPALNQMAFEPLPGSDLRLDAQRGGTANPLQGIVEGLAETSIYFPGLKRPEGFQALVDEALLKEDPADVISLVVQMEKLAYEDVMLVPLWDGQFIAAVHPSVHDVFFFSAGGPNQRLEYAFLGEGAELGAPPVFEPAPPPPPPPPPEGGEGPPPEGEGPPPEGPPPAAYECPNRGGVYTFNYALPADRIGVPKNVIHYNHVYAGLSIEGLVQASNEDAGVYLPRLATSWELAEDKSSYTFHLREGVTFHDGTDFNADVAKWNLDNFIAAGTPLMSNVTSVDVIDDTTIKLNLSSWDSILLDDIARASGMISQQAFEAHDEEWANYNPIGTGPWVLVEFERQQKLVYERNENYWNVGLPCLDGLEILQVPDPMTAIAMIQAGEVSALYQTDPTSAHELISTQDGYSLDLFPGLHNSIVMNTVEPSSIWYDARMREAVEHAIDKVAITEATGYGFSRPYYEIIHSIHEAGGSPGTTPRAYDPDLAKQLMADAGHESVDARLTFSSRQPPDAYVAIQQFLAQVDINIELNPVDDVALNQMSFEPPEGNDLRIEGQRGGLLNPLGSTKETLTSKSVYFPGLMRPEGFDALVEQALASQDPAEVMDLLSQAEKLAYEGMMFVPLWNMPIISVDDGSIQGMIWAFGGTPSPRFDWAYLP